MGDKARVILQHYPVMIPAYAGPAEGYSPITDPLSVVDAVAEAELLATEEAVIEDRTIFIPARCVFSRHSGETNVI